MSSGPSLTLTAGQAFPIGSVSYLVSGFHNIAPLLVFLASHYLFLIASEAVYPRAQALAPLSINTHSYGTSSSPMISGGIHILMDPSCIISSYLSLGSKLAYSSENFASPPGCLIGNANSVTKSEFLLSTPPHFIEWHHPTILNQTGAVILDTFHAPVPNM